MPLSLWQNKSLAVLGGGNMAEALIRGALNANVLSGGQICLYDPLPARRELFQSLGCRTVERAEALPETDAFLIAVKPQLLLTACKDLSPVPKHLIISIVAGVTIATLGELFPGERRFVRVMPNTPLLVGAGMSALAKGGAADDGDLKLAAEIFSAAGETVTVPEHLLDAVTALSGSGPAYLFRLAEALTEAGVKLGFSEELAKILAVNTLYGSAKMLRENPDAALLRERVTSPGGTTAAALAVLNEGGFMDLMARALTAARDRGRELGQRK